LFAFFLISRYLKIKDNPGSDIVPRTAIVSGKAAPGYFMAKLVIKFINSIAEIINNDPEVKGLLKVVFLENYGVTLAEKIFPASDLSEQISTAGTEASGTGNMKFMLNGALTIGTWDGANIEIAREVGLDNIFIFGLKSDEVQKLKEGQYVPRDYLRNDPRLNEIMALIQSNFFSQFEPGIFKPVYDSLYGQDPFMLFADFAMYLTAQKNVDKNFRDIASWTAKSILNTARAGKFSSDRAIKEYARDIWGVK
jgi:starch phosphorylase